MKYKHATQFNLFKSKLTVVTNFKVITPDFNDNLPPTIYKPFLQQLFSVLAKTKSNHGFVLTGSAARQLQDPNHKNPNDIDILMDVGSDLDVEMALLISALKNIPSAGIVYNNNEGTLGVYYSETLIKLQLIDFKTGPHCYPPIWQEKKIKQEETIKMMSTEIIPVKQSITASSLTLNC